MSSGGLPDDMRSEEHTSELQSPCKLVCRLLLEKKKKRNKRGARDACGVWMVSVMCVHVHLQAHWTIITSNHKRVHLFNSPFVFFFFFFNDTATTEIYTLSLHDALPIYRIADADQPRQPLRAAEAG